MYFDKNLTNVSFHLDDPGIGQLFQKPEKNYRRALSSCFGVKIKLYEKFLILMMTEEILHAIYEASILFTNYNDNLRLLARN